MRQVSNIDRKDFSKANLCIVGGKGRMGRWLESQFQLAGMNPVIFDSDMMSSAEELIPSFDVVILAVPIPVVQEVMKSIGSFLRKDAAVIDISSIKREPINQMILNCQAEVIGSHPLFGPSTPSFSGQVVFLCPARPGGWTEAFRSFLNVQGARVLEIDPDAHDKLMACVQTLRHMMLTALGKTLMSLNFDLSHDLCGSGEWFQQLEQMMEHQFKQPSELYADLALENPYSEAVIQSFIDNLSSLGELMRVGDRSGLVCSMDAVASFLTSKETVSEDSAWGWRNNKGGGSRQIEV